MTPAPLSRSLWYVQNDHSLSAERWRLKTWNKHPSLIAAPIAFDRRLNFPPYSSKSEIWDEIYALTAWDRVVVLTCPSLSYDKT